MDLVLTVHVNIIHTTWRKAVQTAQMGVKNLPANAENTREVNSILDLEDPLK